MQLCRRHNASLYIRQIYCNYKLYNNSAAAYMYYIVHIPRVYSVTSAQFATELCDGVTEKATGVTWKNTLKFWFWMAVEILLLWLFDSGVFSRVPKYSGLMSNMIASRSITPRRYGVMSKSAWWKCDSGGFFRHAIKYYVGKRREKKTTKSAYTVQNVRMCFCNTILNEITKSVS